MQCVCVSNLCVVAAHCVLVTAVVVEIIVHALCGSQWDQHVTGLSSAMAGSSQSETLKVHLMVPRFEDSDKKKSPPNLHAGVDESDRRLEKVSFVSARTG